MGGNFGYAYFGGKVKVTDFPLIPASYGFGFGPERSVINPDSLTTFIGAEAKDWFKTGVVLVEGYGLKVTERVPLVVKPNSANARYLRTKREKLGHKIGV